MTKNHSTLNLQRRGYNLGEAKLNTSEPDSLLNWSVGKPTLLKGACLAKLVEFNDDINRSDKLYAALLNNEECDTLLTHSPYAERLAPNFESLGCTVNEGDEQEIETIIFDAIAANDPQTIIAEDLWMKASWLSFFEGDASLRFRFSFGLNQFEDVAADTHRQQCAAQLTDAIFRESRAITENKSLHSTLQKTLNCSDFHFVERIIYFNSPNGGAYLHHDRERGHAGVVYAQLSGQTFWLALTKQTLLDEISIFAKECEKNQWPSTLTAEYRKEIRRCIADTDILSAELETFSNSALIHLINETQGFAQQLIRHGHSRHVKAGDVLLLPQSSELSCCWHSVFCLGQESGEALSFAVRSAE